MNEVFLQSLGLSQSEKDMLACTTHRWVEVKGGAVVFFAKEGKAHFLAYPIPLLPSDVMAEFWQAVGSLPMVSEIESRFFTDNPVGEEELIGLTLGAGKF